MTRNFFIVGRSAVLIYFFFWLSFYLYSGCSGGGGNSCISSCTPGKRSCASEKKKLIICAKDPLTNCYRWVSVNCRGGSSCVTSGGAALCSSGSAGGCKNKKFKKGCLGNRIYWFDDCGNPASEILSCPDGTVCSDGKCEYPSGNCPAGGCSEGEFRCKGRDQVEKCVAGPDGCPVWKVVKSCPSGQFCSAGSCASSCNNLCRLGDMRCNKNSVEVCEKDSNGCLVWTVDTECKGGATCQNGKCVSNCAGECREGEKKCSSDGKAVQVCKVDGSGCAVWKTLETCKSGESCSGGRCQSSCKDQCKEGDKRCDNNAVSVCKKGSDGCLSWTPGQKCGAGEICRSGKCEPKCKNSCTVGDKRCAGSSIEECRTGPDNCPVWQKAAQCPSDQVCYSGRCVSQKDPSQRTEQEVCSRWKQDYPITTPASWKNNGTQCDPGSISQGSIDDTIRRTNLYRWLVGLPPVSEDKQYSKGAQACAIIQANNGLNHRPPPSATCYNQLGAKIAGQSNLAMGSRHPADMVTMFIADRGVSSLGHRLWVLNARLGKTGFGLARGKGPYGGYGGCMFVFDYSNKANPPDFIAFPSPGPFPIQAISYYRRAIEDWSVVSRKYKLYSVKNVNIVRLNDNASFSVKTRSVGLGYFSKGIAWKVPFTPKAGENYKVEVGNLFSYTVKFFDCR